MGPPDRDQGASPMGFNATRRYRDGKNNDLWLLVAAVVILGVLLAWAFGAF